MHAGRVRLIVMRRKGRCRAMFKEGTQARTIDRDAKTGGKVSAWAWPERGVCNTYRMYMKQYGRVAMSAGLHARRQMSPSLADSPLRRPLPTAGARELARAGTRGKASGAPQQQIIQLQHHPQLVCPEIVLSSASFSSWWCVARIGYDEWEG